LTKFWFYVTVCTPHDEYPSDDTLLIVAFWEVCLLSEDEAKGEVKQREGRLRQGGGKMKEKRKEKCRKNGAK